MRRGVLRAGRWIGLAVASLALGAERDPAAAGASGEGRVVAATVYRDRVLVTRALEVQLARGSNRVEITGLPAGVDQDSIRISARGPEGTVLEGFETRTVTAGEVEDPEFQAAEAALRSLQRKLTEKRDFLATVSIQRQFLQSIQAQVPGEIGKGLLTGQGDPTHWQAAFDFLGRNLSYLGMHERAARDDIPDLEREIAAASNRLNQIRSKGRTQTLTAIASLGATTPGKVEVRVEYVTGPASWYPIYEARYDRNREMVEFLEKGMVRQETGEDWSEIDLTLSTAMPGTPLDLPEIQVLALNRGIRTSATKAPVKPEEVGGFIEGLPLVGRDYQDQLVLESGAAADADGNVNIQAARDRALALLELAHGLAGASQAVTSVAALTIVIHEVPLPQDLPSDGEFHRFGIGEQGLRAVREEFRAAPRFREGVFLRARVVNPADHAFLAGKVVTFDGPNLLGSFPLEERASGEEFTVPFGPDPRFRAERKRISRVVDPGNRITTVEYLFRTSLESFHEDAREVALEDQIPVSENEEIQVKLLTGTSEGWEEDPETPGLLRWKVALQPREKREIDLAYQVRYPSDWYVPNLE